MEAEFFVRGRDQHRFEFLEFCETRIDLCLIYVTFRFRKRDVVLEMPGLRREQAAVKPTMPFRESGCDFRKALAGARFD